MENILEAMKQNAKDILNVRQALQTVVDIYNRRPHSSIKFKTPENVVKAGYMSKDLIKPKYTDLVKNNEESFDQNGSFMYDENKKIIDAKMINMQKKFPILSPVKLVTKLRVFAKGASDEKWTRQNYYIHYFKRPYVSSEEVLIKLIDERGREIAGAFMSRDIKIVKLKSMSNLRISGFTEIFKDKKGFKKFLVNMETFPKDIVFLLTPSDLNKYSLSQVALKQLKNSKIQ